MPRVNWGLDEGVIDSFDRDAQYKPYMGPIPPNSTYLWNLKVLKYVAGTEDKHPQLRYGLELVARTKEEKRYAGYFIMGFPPVTNKTQFRYVPLLDALGVSEREFLNQTITDADGNIKKIGRWGNDGKTQLLAELKDGVDQHNQPRKEIGYIAAADSVDDEDDAYDAYDDADDYYDE